MWIALLGDALPKTDFKDFQQPVGEVGGRLVGAANKGPNTDAD